MTSKDEAQRPTAQECKDFFLQIEQKMKLDIEQPENKTRLELSKKIINLEVYANDLQTEINKESSFSSKLSATGLIADKHKKYEETLKTIALLTQMLSAPKIDAKALQRQQDALYETNKSASGFFNFKDRFQQIIEDIMDVTKEEGDEHISNKGKQI
ncbi:hypothetical protein DGG96_04965 [Legionella qingyii]|uniref:Uncharacterized protein n=1 Tax=Legionella qingyii TaxID=2184757 RepID=A0A317U8A0_9GAMM|nr:hypothetical protein [Legionella qingyii]PWY56762.1 hypothetical protein DGG96_04965 [Legionella qingyii]RUR23683.1 hypothetical protein ELY20_06650 [Legionella qingyii]RUR26266.1 hypothetical protein ELY16_07510 [Legionella qingyii]